ncbi:MAG: ATP-grasp domain-containing protein [bacterium]
MNKIYALTDYKGFFGSKWKANPYRSGFDKTLLKHYFNQFGWEIEFIRMHEIDFKQKWENRIVIYTSSEEIGLYYKNFIEDIILGLERAGAQVIPKFDFLRANNNKVYMEILRDQLLGKKLSGISSRFYGTLEELLHELNKEKVSFPCVIKTAAGAMSRGVFLAKDKAELLKYAKKLSRSPHYLAEIKEIVRTKKHKGYKKESKYQNKFIIQNFIPDLKNDWKVLVYGNHYYVLNRGIKKNDFRASGSHHNYKAGSEAGFPEELLNKVKNIYDLLAVPHLSLDFAWDGTNEIVHEFQAIHFGTSTMDFSDDLYVFENDTWNIEKANFSQEEEYVRGIIYYLEKHPELF